MVPGDGDKENVIADTQLWDLQSLLKSQRNIHLHPIPQSNFLNKKLPDQKPQRKFKWEVSVDNAWKFDKATAVPLPDLKNIAWELGIKGSERSESGSGGVFFIEMNSGGIVVVKPSKVVAEEVFTNLLALRLGLYVPKFRLIHSDGTEGDKLMSLILKTDKLGASIFGLSGASYYILKEYIPGKNLDKLIYSEMREIYGNENALSHVSISALNDLARILVLDLLTNYGDRLPFLWPNQGNSGNLMITPSGQFICIENGFNLIKDTGRFETYKNLIADIVTRLSDNCNKELPEFQHVNQRIFGYTDYSFQTTGVLHLQKSFLEVLKEITSELDPFISQMNQWKSLMSQFNPPILALDTIDIPFISQILTLIKTKIK
eukprot:TRINITY_DN16621_c0_g1_i1.p1 TRINITY_DN16621_c0_g1~~TRINITY_DN16621_c0_g1_i1.p1  ORF type:complete len:375 (+),score=60.50 TRINITY_DN16621_c0_g1_i1:16-1140(+)